MVHTQVQNLDLYRLQFPVQIIVLLLNYPCYVLEIFHAIFCNKNGSKSITDFPHVYRSKWQGHVERISKGRCPKGASNDHSVGRWPETAKDHLVQCMTWNV